MKNKNPFLQFFKNRKYQKKAKYEDLSYSYTYSYSSDSVDDDNNDENKYTFLEQNTKVKLDVSPSKSEEVNNEEKKAKLDVSSAIFHEIQKESNKCLFIDEEDEKYHVFVEQISQNNFFILTKIIDIRNDRVMCKKTLITEEDSFKHLKNIMKEFDLFQSIDHPCICKMYGINTSETLKTETDEDITTISLFLEYIDYDLNDCINKKKLSNTIKARIIIVIVHGMIFIHNHGLIHRGLQTENIRLNSFLKSKIVDLGLVKIKELLVPNYSFSQTSFQKGFGSAIFMSPELLKEEDYDNKTDVYSFGILLYNVFTEKLPKYSLKDKNNQKDFPLPNPSSSISEFCINLISSCLSFDPKNRPSFDEILNQIRTNNYLFADNIDQKLVSQRDNELNMNDS